MTDNKRLDDRSDFNNRVMLLIVLALIFGIPAYCAMIGSVVWMYGFDYFFRMLFDPQELWVTFTKLMHYWMENKKQLPSDYNMKILGPPAMAIFTSGMICFIMRAPLLDFRPFKSKELVHGDAHWATKKEIAKAGLFAKNGVLIGEYGKGKYYVADGFQHLLLFAPTGSGKGVGFAIPNLLFWEQSCCVHDIKLENYDLCSGWRAKQGQAVYVWNPADPNGITHCYNPMDWISTKPGQQVDDVQKIANLIMPEQEFWQNEARSLLVGVILYLVAVPEKLTSFGEVVRTMRSDDVTYNLAVVLDTIGKKIHPVAYMNIAAFLQKADKERSGVVSTMNSGLELWANPLIDTATATSDFSIMQWKKQKITVYCGVTPDNLQRLQPLLQVFYQQGSDMLTRQMPQPDEPYGVLFLLDEFPTLGKMPQFEAGIAYFRGYKVRLFLIVQDTQQLKGIYEEAGMNSFLSNATFRITFAANNVETANLISQLIGNKTVRQESHNMPKFLDLNPAARTKHVSEAQRALLLPQEVIQLPRDDQIVLIESQPPIRCKKIKYYADPFFTRRLLEKTFVPTQEPYDPRKNDKPAGDKPEDKPDTAKKDAKGPPPGPAGKNVPATTSGPKPPAPPAAAGDAKKNPFDLPPLPPKKEGSGSDVKKNPFDLPPLPPKADGAAGAKPAGNPFDLPPKPPGGAPAAANPFGAPAAGAPAAPAGGSAPAAAPAANPFAAAPAPAKAPAAPAETGNPFAAPPKPPEGFDIKPKAAVTDPFEATASLSASTATAGHPTPEKFGPPVPEPSLPPGKEKPAPKVTPAAPVAPANPFAAAAPAVNTVPAAPAPTAAPVASVAPVAPTPANPFAAASAVNPAPTPPSSPPIAPVVSPPVEVMPSAATPANPFAPAAVTSSIPVVAAPPTVAPLAAPPANPFTAAAAKKDEDANTSSGSGNAAMADPLAFNPAPVPKPAVVKPATPPASSAGAVKPPQGAKPASVFGMIPLKKSTPPDGSSTNAS